MLRAAVARRLHQFRRATRPLRHPAPVWLLHVGTLWFWHASVPYQAVLDHELVHAVEHATFLVTGVLFWSMIHQLRQVAPGAGIPIIFATAMQGVFLSALLTFAGAPWYPGYAQTTSPWGPDATRRPAARRGDRVGTGRVVYAAPALALLGRLDPAQGAGGRRAGDRRSGTRR